MNKKEKHNSDETIDDLLQQGDVEKIEKIIDSLEGNDKAQENLQRTLMNYLIMKKDKEGVIKIIEATKNWASQKGRIKKFENEFGVKYTGCQVEKKLIKNPNSNSDHIRNALVKKDFDDAIFMLTSMDIVAFEHPDKESFEYLELCQKIVHRESEIIDGLCEEKMFDKARELLDVIEENPHHIKFDAKNGLKKKIDRLEK